MQNNNLNKVDNNSRSRTVIWGVVFVALGLLLLGFNTGLIPMVFKRVIISWQMLLIVIGVFEYSKRHNTSGTILVIIGMFFMIPRLIKIFPFCFPFMATNFTTLYWPLLLIVIGLIVLVNSGTRSERRANRREKKGKCKRRNSGREEVRDGGYYDRNIVFGNMEIIILDKEFQGAELNTVFGQITLDLRNTTIPEGKTFVEVNSVFGGIVILAPAEWMVVTKFDNIFGGFVDRRPTMLAGSPERILYVKGSCVFGGGEIRN